MTRIRCLLSVALLAAACALLPAVAQAQMTAAELVTRLDRMENQIRQLTGVIEQLQFRNQQLEGQIKRLQEDTEFRFQELGGKPRPGQARPAPAPQMAPAPHAAPGPQPPAPAAPPRRSDVFDPNANPNAPGAPRTLGAVAATPGAAPPVPDDVGAPGGRPAGAPLDLATLSPAPSGPAPAAAPPQPGLLPPPPPRNPNATGQQIVMAPSQAPKDEFDLAYGYVLRKDYALAEEALRAFLKKHPSDRLVPDANYWLGESLFQRQRYRDSAEQFLTVSTKFASSAKAPDALLRLGQSLAALKEREAACATLAEIARKYPRASPSVKQAAEREQKRAKC